MDSVGKGTMNRRESSGEDEIIDPLYNGRICHAQCWSSYPDFAAKIVSWIAVTLELVERRSPHPACSTVPGLPSCSTKHSTGKQD